MAAIQDLVLRAAADKQFAKKLLANPAKFARTYNLTAAQVTSIRDLASRGGRIRVPGRGASASYY